MEKKNRKPRIAVIGLKGLPAFGGAATVGENIIEQLKDKYDLTVYSTSSHTDLKTGEYHGYKQIVFKKLQLKKINSLYYYIISAIHAVVLGKYDLVHLHHRDAAFIIPFIKIRYKVILTVHGFGAEDLSDKWNKFRWYFKLQELLFVGKTDFITTMSLEQKEIIEKQINKSVYYIPNGINPITMRKETEDYILFVAGRIVTFKGCHIFLRALHEINYKGRVLIAGDLDITTNYGKAILDMSIGLDIHFLGLLKDKNELFQYYNNAKLFVFPSQLEAMSMVLLEVASMKTPIIASRIPGNTQVFSDEEVTYFNVNDVKDLSAKIEVVFSDYNLALSKSDQAFSKLKNYYTWDKIAKQYEEILNSIID